MSELSSFMPDLSASPQRREAGVGTRGLARILLVSWLFTLVVCFYSDIHQSSTNLVEDISVAHEHNGLEHSDTAQDTDACCTILQNLPPFFKVSNIEAPLQHLMHVLLPYVFVVQTALLVTASVQFVCPGPPGKPCNLLTANVLWPNAPPC